jgi:hypothetical protein
MMSVCRHFAITEIRGRTEKADSRPKTNIFPLLTMLIFFPGEAQEAYTYM